MYTGLDVGKYIVKKCNNDGCAISNLALQKIMYFVQIDSLVNANERAISDDMQAWMLGPVTPSVYYHYCAFGSTVLPSEDLQNEISKSDSDRYDKIIDKYKKTNVWDLVDETHKIGSAWYRTYQKGAGAFRVISDELMKECKY